MKSDLGVPTLSSSVSSTSTTTAATSSAVKQAYDLANSAGSIADDTATLLGLDPDDDPVVDDALTVLAKKSTFDTYMLFNRGQF
jgi:hypothetical protein